MVLAIAALFVHLHAVAAVSQPLAAVSSSQERSSGTSEVSASAAAALAEQTTKETLLATNTGLTLSAAPSFDGSQAPSSSETALSPSSFASVVRSSESLSAIRIVTPESKALRFVEPESTPSRRKWLALAAAEHAAAAFDAYSTRLAIGRGALEADPLMRPFAESAGIYAAIQVAPVALDFAARHMQRSQIGFLRRTWWVPQSAATGMFLFSGMHNLHVASQPH
ncbi:MAG TPA: hypothetical protein VG322_03875 [Candidatus Acidoferrales bacterium]|jgi:hypothetical protein|nr:hypothetical protein [Candidatus Acidoferrales bacterium]